MVQAQQRELLNRKDDKNAANMLYERGHPLYAATERLLMALERLENGLKGAPRDQQLGFFENENASLLRERNNLNGAIGELENQYADLHRTASTIYNKLDDSIKRLSRIMEG